MSSLDFNSDEGGPGSSAVNGEGTTSGIRLKHARYRCSASVGSVEKSTCTTRRFVSASCHRIDARIRFVDQPKMKKFTMLA